MAKVSAVMVHDSSGYKTGWVCDLCQNGLTHDRHGGNVRRSFGHTLAPQGESNQLEVYRCTAGCAFDICSECWTAVKSTPSFDVGSRVQIIGLQRRECRPINGHLGTITAKSSEDYSVDLDYGWAQKNVRVQPKNVRAVTTQEPPMWWCDVCTDPPSRLQARRLGKPTRVHGKSCARVLSLEQSIPRVAAQWGRVGEAALEGMAAYGGIRAILYQQEQYNERHH
jgi:hypothetical protein